MRVVVISPEQSVFDGEADQVVAPAFDGEVGILPRHAPFMALLGRGVLTVRHGSSSSRFDVGGGFVQVINDVVRVVAGSAKSA